MDPIKSPSSINPNFKPSQVVILGIIIRAFTNVPDNWLLIKKVRSLLNVAIIAGPPESFEQLILLAIKQFNRLGDSLNPGKPMFIQEITIAAWLTVLICIGQMDILSKGPYTDPAKGYPHVRAQVPLASFLSFFN